MLCNRGKECFDVWWVAISLTWLDLPFLNIVNPKGQSDVLDGTLYSSWRSSTICFVIPPLRFLNLIKSTYVCECPSRRSANLRSRGVHFPLRWKVVSDRVKIKQVSTRVSIIITATLPSAHEKARRQSDRPDPALSGRRHATDEYSSCVLTNFICLCVTGSR